MEPIWPYIYPVAFFEAGILVSIGVAWIYRKVTSQ